MVNVRTVCAWGVVALAAIGWAAVAASTGDMNGVGYAARLGGSIMGYPFQTGTASIEGAMAWDGLTLVAAADMPYLPHTAWNGTSRVVVTTNWLAVSFDAAYDPALPSPDLSLQVQAVPPAGLLLDAPIVCLAGADLAACVPLATAVGTAEHSLTVSPYLTGIAYVDAFAVTATTALDAMLGSATQPRITAARLRATVDLGDVDLTNTVTFRGAFESFAALTIALGIEQLGVTVSASLLPAADGTDTFRVQVGGHVTFGDPAVLPAAPGAGSQCTGDTCY